jgi:GNAT superfamily N-acetyltransferase
VIIPGIDSDSVVVRAARPSDAADIARVHVEAWRAAYVDIVPQAVLDRLSVDRRRDGWMRRLGEPAESRTIVASAGGRIVGTAELDSIYLLPEVWHRGIGRDLIERALGDLAERGFSTVILWVLSDNARGRHFYEAGGWRPDGGVETLDFDGTSLGAVRYRLDLRARPIRFL